MQITTFLVDHIHQKKNVSFFFSVFVFSFVSLYFVGYLSMAPFPFALLFPCSFLTFGIHCFLQFNCFLLMPVVDKLPALLREDLESAFEDELDNVFDITNLQHSLGERKRDTEIELKRVLYTISLLFSFFFFFIFPFVALSMLEFSFFFFSTCWWVCRYRGLRRNSGRYMSSLVFIRLCQSCHQFLCRIRASF